MDSIDLTKMSTTKRELLMICHKAILLVDDKLVKHKKLTVEDIEEECTPSLGTITIDRSGIGSSMSIDGNNITNFDLF